MGFPTEILKRGETPADYGINAIWVDSGRLEADEIDRYHKLGLKVFAEFNSMHAADYLKEHPDAAPIGPDGKPSPPPHGWQGVSPFHAGYRQDRMQEFRRILKTFEIDGIWLDYHHAHASWERDEPSLPDTDFSPTALKQFTAKTGIELPAEVPKAGKLLLGKHRDAWTKFRCGVFTDWVREYREVLDEVRPKALLGTFHCLWSPRMTTARFVTNWRSTWKRKSLTWMCSASCPTTRGSDTSATQPGLPAKSNLWESN